jgi:voltage-gated potassium channel
MPLILSRIIARLVSQQSWATPILIVLILFATSWPLMRWAEPPASELVSVPSYWWWFVVTATTVGYGDLYPDTLAGRCVAKPLS